MSSLLCRAGRLHSHGPLGCRRHHPGLEDSEVLHGVPVLCEGPVLLTGYLPCQELGPMPVP